MMSSEIQQLINKLNLERGRGLITDQEYQGRLAALNELLIPDPAAETSGDEIESVADIPNSVTRYQQLQERRLQPGITIDRFELVELVGEGGMGLVWKAIDPNRRSDREPGFVVLKFLKPQEQQNQAAINRSRKSFQTICNLQHQNICPVYDFKEHPEFGCFLVMKYINGVTLAQYREIKANRDGRLKVERVARVISGISTALAEAHQAGIVHRDIKPQNVLIDRVNGRVQLIDFGLAGEMAQVDQSSAGLHASGGTIAYMAPEQMLNKKQTAASDQFSLAVIAWELLTGSRPFDWPAPTLIIKAMQTGDLPNSDCPEPVLATLKKALSFDRKQRYSSVIEFSSHLKAATKNETKPKPVLPKKRARRETNQNSTKTSPTATPAIGTRIDEYVLYERLGERTWKADGANSFDQVVLTFRGSAQLGGIVGRDVPALDHAGIRKVIKGLSDRNRGEIVVEEFVEGESLAHHAGPMDPQRVAGLISQICTAVQFAHDHQIVHGAITPSQIIIDTAGHPMLLGFHNTEPRRTELLPQKAFYLCPEQRNGQRITAAADQFGIGLIALKLLIGQLSNVELNIKTLPAAMQSVFRTVLHQTPTDRYPNMMGFSAALVAAIDEPVSNTPAEFTQNPQYDVTTPSSSRRELVEEEHVETQQSDDPGCLFLCLFLPVLFGGAWFGWIHGTSIVWHVVLALVTSFIGVGTLGAFEPATGIIRLARAMMIGCVALLGYFYLDLGSARDGSFLGWMIGAFLCLCMIVGISEPQKETSGQS